MSDQIRQRPDEVEVMRILREFDVHSLHRLFEPDALVDLRELLVDMFQSPKWTLGRHFSQRNHFILAIAEHQPTSDQHRQLFHALAESGNGHGVIAYLRMLKANHRAKLQDRSALISSSDVLRLLNSAGLGIAGNIHYLAKAMVPGDPRVMQAIWSKMHKIHNPDHPHATKWLVAMQTVVNRFGLQSTGLGASNVDNTPWIHLFLRTPDKATMQIAGSVLASQLSRNLLDKKDLIAHAQDVGQGVRISKTFGYPLKELSIQALRSSHQHSLPAYDL